MTSIDYSKFSTLDLLDAMRNIDKENYPENYKNLVAEFNNRPDKDIESKMEAAEEATIKKNYLEWYSLKHWTMWVPAISYVAWILLGIYRGSVFVPGHRYGGAYLTRKNGLLFLLGLAIVFGAGLFRRFTLNKLAFYRKYYLLILWSGLLLVFYSIMTGKMVP